MLKKLPKTTTGTSAESLRLLKIYHDPNANKHAKAKALTKLFLINDLFVLKRVERKRRIAEKRYGSAIVDDMLSHARLGLLSAIKKFEPERGKAFLTYAVWYIDRGVNHCLNEAGLMSRQYASQRLDSLKSKSNSFYNEHGRNPSDDELVELGFSRTELKNLREYSLLSTKIIALDKSYDDSDTTLLDLLPGAAQEEPTDYIWDFVAEHCGSEQNLEIMKMRYLEDCTTATIGDKFGVSKQRIQQRHQDILKRLRKHIAKLDLE